MMDTFFQLRTVRGEISEKVGDFPFNRDRDYLRE
jgi:hypothetical protein